MRPARFVPVLLAVLAACATPRQRIEAPAAPAAVGPYSQGIAVGGMLWVAGQIGRNPRSGALDDASIESETHRTLQNVGAVLAAAGFTFADVVQTQVFLVDLADFERMNAVYATYFPAASPPARATVQVAALPKGARIEVMAVAARAAP
jgi:2-iminobutanoate/2-iminopropanoate deaminase